MIRVLDIILSLTALMLLSPLFIVVAVANKMTGERDVFYLQVRAGRGGNKFKVFKFATMVRDSESRGAGFFVAKEDDRLLPLGKILRKTKINEFPQLVNVIRGEMSLVGWRPLIPETYARMRLANNNEDLQGAPGITGISSIYFRDEERELQLRDDYKKYYFEEMLPKKLKLERMWRDNSTVKNYFLILGLTVFVLIMPRSEIAKKILMASFSFRESEI